MGTDTEITSEINAIGEILASMSEMKDIRVAVDEIGGQIIAAEDDCVLVSCKDAVDASRRVKGSLANAVVGKLDNQTIFLRRVRK